MRNNMEGGVLSAEKTVLPLSNRRGWRGYYLTTRTEQELCWTTLVETLPSRKRAIAPSPLAPITIKSARCLDATFMISSAGFPS